jgi:hypothetical protein
VNLDVHQHVRPALLEAVGVDEALAVIEPAAEIEFPHSPLVAAAKNRQAEEVSKKKARERTPGP